MVNATQPVRILAMMEAASITGPAKNLIGFCRWLGTAEGQQSGLRVAIATFDRNARPLESDSFAGAARAAGIETHVIRERYRFDLGVVPQLRQIVTGFNPAIIQTHNNKSHLLVRALPDLRAKRIWLAFKHGDVYVDLKQRLYNQVDRATLPRADRVISVCQAFTSQLAAYGVDPDRIRVLHNAATVLPPVPASERVQTREQLGIQGDERLLLSVGRLSKEKGHADLLRALHMMTADVGPWKLVIVGIGPERDRLMRLAKSLSIDSRIVFAGFRADLAALFPAADVFILPSHSEGSANVLLEAMMARVPIVATAAGGNPEIVLNGKTGLITSIANPGALQRAITRLLSEQELARELAEAAFTRGLEEFSVNRYRGRLTAIYAEALRGQTENDHGLSLPAERKRQDS